MQPAPAPADQVQRRLALEPGRSFIVQAPAGSGKTELLIQRYLVLLEGVAQPESILAITFTRKAAAEMRSRILQAMRRAGSEAEPETANEALTWRLARAALEQDRRHGWQLERNPSRLRIQTIDALCVSITGRMPWLARFGAMPEIVEQAKALYEEAARATLYLLEGEDQYAASVERLVAHLDNKAGVAQYLLAGLLDRRDQWLRHLAAGDDPAAWRREMERLLERAGRICVEKLRDLFPEELVEETLTLARYAAGNLQEDAGVPESGLPEDVEGWRAVAQLLITQDGKGWRKQVTKRQGFPTTNRGMIQRFYSVRDELDKVEGLFEAFRELRYAPPPHYEDQQWELMEDLLEVLPAAAAQLKVVFQRRGAVDFTELTHAALRALGEEGEPTDLAFSLGHRVEHILVDEMQDTSHSQVRLLTMLTAAWEPGDGRTLFLVGDPMQSIYRFREAEVGLFVRMCAEGLPALPLERLQLSANFRSDAELVDWVNQSFAGIFPAAADFSSGAVPYNASVAFRPAAGAEAVTIHTQASDDADAEARLVAELVEKSAGGTTAILVRARGHLPPIVEELKRRGIAYRAVEIDPLTTRPVIRDLLALTRAILHPGDRTAWLAILRAPWCGLTLEQLHRLAADDAKAIMWDRITPSTPALARFHKAMAGALSRVRRQRLRSSVERAWIELGGPACLGGEIEYQEAKRYFEKLESMEQGGEVDDFARLEAALEELHAAPDAGAPETLEIMTIHKAKGLEFDTVIVPGLARETQSGEGGLLHWATIEVDGEPATLFAPSSSPEDDERDPVYRYVQHLDRRKEDHETLRLLYVAATRARRRLHLVSHNGKRSGTLAAALWPVLEPHLSQAGKSAAQEEAVVREPRAIHRLPADWQAPGRPENVVWYPGEEARALEEQVSFDWAGEALRHVGTVVHGYLERIATEGLAVWSAERIEERRQQIRTALVALGVTRDELDRASERVRQALAGTLRDAKGRWILSPREVQACEFAASASIHGMVRHIRVDRTFVDEEGTRWIIDYKTSLHEGGDLDAFLDNEAERYRGQLLAYARWFAGAEGRRVRCALYFPLLGGWREIEAAQSA